MSLFFVSNLVLGSLVVMFRLLAPPKKQTSIIPLCLLYGEGKYHPSNSLILQFLKSIELESTFGELNIPEYVFHRISLYLSFKINQAIFYGNNGAYINWREDPLSSWRNKQKSIHFAFQYNDIKRLAGRYVRNVMDWIDEVFPAVIKYKPGSHAYLREFNPHNFFAKKRKDLTKSYFWKAFSSSIQRRATKRGFKRLASKWGCKIADKIIKETDMVKALFKSLFLPLTEYRSDKIALNLIKRMMKCAKPSNKKLDCFKYAVLSSGFT